MEIVKRNVYLESYISVVRLTFLDLSCLDLAVHDP